MEETTATRAMKWGLLVCASSALALGGCAIGDGADDGEAVSSTASELGTAYNKCGVTIRGTENAAGHYFLSSDVTVGPAGTCVTIDAPGKTVALDCGGHTMKSPLPFPVRPGMPFPVGVWVKNGSATLANCGTRGDFGLQVRVTRGGNATIVGGTYAEGPNDVFSEARIVADGGSLTIFSGTFQSPVRSVYEGGLRILGGDFSVASGWAVDHAEIFGGNFHDTGTATSNSRIHGGSFYANKVAANAWGLGTMVISGGRFYSNDVAVKAAHGGTVTLSGGTFTGNTTDLSVTEEGNARVDGGTMCDANKANIVVESGTITGDEDAKRASCRQVSPAGIYACNPCEPPPPPPIKIDPNRSDL